MIPMCLDPKEDLVHTASVKLHPLAAAACKSWSQPFKFKLCATSRLLKMLHSKASPMAHLSCGRCTWPPCDMHRCRFCVMQLNCVDAQRL
jgi:hypothetical protein